MDMDYKEKAKELRREIVKMIYEAKSGHPGGSLSIVEILIALYYEVMNVASVKEYNLSKWESSILSGGLGGRKVMIAPTEYDKFVLSKGHACPALYAVLADIGYIEKSELAKLRKIDGDLQGHPDFRKTKGIDVNTGSLGQGASISVGLALAAKQQKNDVHVYTILGDGECQEGIVWEASMAAAHYKLDNLTFILDKNNLQIDGSNDEVMSLGDIVGKFKAFGFDTYEVDGHNIEALVDTLNREKEGMPKFVCANTIKGKGVSFMENQVGWHGKALNDEEYIKAMKELE